MSEDEYYGRQDEALELLDEEERFEYRDEERYADYLTEYEED